MLIPQFLVGFWLQLEVTSTVVEERMPKGVRFVPPFILAGSLTQGCLQYLDFSPGIAHFPQECSLRLHPSRLSP